MKKNVMMRVASIMLVLVLMTSSVISGTFAKYVTDGQATDKARVAKFGVSVTGKSDMFDTTYNADDTGRIRNQSEERGQRHRGGEEASPGRDFREIPGHDPESLRAERGSAGWADG